MWLWLSLPLGEWMAEAHIVESGGPRLPTQQAAREPERPSLAPRLKRSVIQAYPSVAC
jgi:hypothetical protein